MRSRVLRHVVLVCSLLLALPQGWCCLHAFQLPKTTITAPVKPAGCCICCKHETQPQPTQTEKPSDLPPSCCCCTDQPMVAPSSAAVQKVSLDLAFLEILPVPPLMPHLVQLIGEAASVVHPPTHQLHIFKCVWLC